MKIEYLNCPLCNSQRFASYKSADATKHAFYHPELPPVIEWMKCDECGHVFTSTYWTDEAWKLIFAETHSNQIAGRQDAEVHRYISGRIVGNVLWFSRHSHPEDWLDVGCGNGSLLFAAAEFGFDAHGLDLRQAAVDEITKLDYKASCQSIENFSATYGPRFSVVSMADLLEHTPFPKITLGAAKRALKYGGLLYVSCPNMDTATWKILGDDNPYWWEIEHFHNFSRARLTDLLNECGFEVLHYGVSERYLSGMEMICRAKS